MIKQVTPRQLNEMMRSGASVHLIDVREDDEREICSIGGAHIPLKQIEERHAEIPRSGTVILYCRSGGRSARAIEALQTGHGFENLSNLAGGILGWIDEIDPTMTKY